MFECLSMFCNVWCPQARPDLRYSILNYQVTERLYRRVFTDAIEHSDVRLTATYEIIKAALARAASG